MLSKENRSKIEAMQAEAWRKISPRISLLETFGEESRDLFCGSLVRAVNREKAKIQEALDKMPDEK